MEDEHRILLVEDDPQDVELTLRALKNGNLQGGIHVARDGEEALDYLFRRGEYQDSLHHSPSLILMDLKLPKIDGLQVIEQVKSSAETRSIPVVVLSSSGEQRDVFESYRRGVNSYIQKPVDIQEFRQAIRTLVLYWTVINRSPVLSAPEKNPLQHSSVEANG
jgi:two-component system, response regulator